MSSFYMGLPILARSLLIVGQTNPFSDDRNHNLSPTPSGTLGHNLWKLFLAGNTVDTPSRTYRNGRWEETSRGFDRTDYAFACELRGLCRGEWSEEEANIRGEEVRRHDGAVLLLGSRVWKAVFPHHHSYGLPCKTANFFCIAHPASNNRAYEDGNAHRENAKTAAQALCYGFTTEIKRRKYLGGHIDSQGRWIVQSDNMEGGNG